MNNNKIIVKFRKEFFLNENKPYYCLYGPNALNFLIKNNKFYYLH